MMKIWIDGIIRDMTEEEEAAFIAEHENQPDHNEPEDIINILLGGDSE